MSDLHISRYLNEADGNRWYAAYTKPRSEQVGALQIERQGYEVYLPMYKSLKRTLEGMVVQRTAMFPRYVFFRPRHSGQSIAPIRSTRGISHIVRFGIEPATISAELVAAMRAFEIEREQTSASDLSALKAGRRVAVCAGPLKGLEGLVSATAGTRITVLLDVLGSQTRVSVPDHHLQAVAV